MRVLKLRLATEAVADHFEAGDRGLEHSPRYNIVLRTFGFHVLPKTTVKKRGQLAEFAERGRDSHHLLAGGQLRGEGGSNT